MTTRPVASMPERGRAGTTHSKRRLPLAALAIAATLCTLTLTGCPEALSPIYGDGSAGDVTVTSDTNLADLDPDGNLQFHNLTVNATAMLTVPSGGIIRCTGSFVNNGTVVVGPGGAGGTSGGNLGDAPGVSPDPGISSREAGGGETGPSSGLVEGGSRGLGVDLEEAEFILDVAPGGGGGAYSGTSPGGDGGGGMLVLAGVSILNSGSISANGANGPAGGGGGGIIIFASPGSIKNTGTLQALGGNGGEASGSRGAGGGGGGGIVHFMSPTIDTTYGHVYVDGGTGGTGHVVTLSPRTGGGGGGASGGHGGRGGNINAAPSNGGFAGENGDDGYVITSLTDPTPWFK